MIAIENVTQILVALVFSGARMGAALIVAPFFSSQLITGLARNIVIINLTMILVPLVMTAMPADISGWDFVVILLKEVFIGLMMGVIMGIVFFIADCAGAFIDTQRGSNMGQVFDPVAGDQITSLGSLFTKIVLYLFFVGGGFMAFLGLMYNSYKLWPIFAFFPNLRNPVFPQFVLEIADKIMLETVLIAAPIAIIMFLVEFGLGMMNRFAPQLNVFSLSMPIKSGVAMFIIILYMKIIIELFKLQILDDRKTLILFEKIFS
ncbi:MAG: EscT/YscT/HrcT family type III secretion system export apparatus protein [Verrucomicrobia bacterium]|nr:MAG: EscT/YscT/HrcT family type III secretion system export apparatus protein [Verrucomicrobiota bacterium]